MSISLGLFQLKKKADNGKSGVGGVQLECDGG
jgi:hypothetical protein